MRLQLETARNHRHILRVSLLLLLIWLFVIPLLYRSVQKGGISVFPTDYDLVHTQRAYGGDFNGLRLEDSYQTWAVKQGALDSSGYVKAALAFADGKGISTPLLINGKTQYWPFTRQGAGTPCLIAVTIMLFGAQHVFPYFVLICAIHFLTAVLVVYFAAGYTERFSTLLLAGILSLLSLPILYFNFCFGLFLSEPLSELLLIAALICMQNFWRHGRNDRKQAVIAAVGFGVLIGIAAYVRSTCALFGVFCCACIIIACWHRGFKNAAIFVVTACLTLSLVQLPWEMRNLRLIGQFTMQDTQYYGHALWVAHWADWKGMANNVPLGCAGLGNYLNPQLSNNILKELNANARIGSAIASKALFREIIRHPRKTFLFRMSGYDSLWFGNRVNVLSRVFSFVSLIGYLLFAWRNRRAMPPELWAFPLFMLFLSVLIHYESRYVHPFYLFITPVSIALLIEQWRSSRAMSLGPTKGQEIAIPADIQESVPRQNEYAEVRWCDYRAMLNLKSMCIVVACLLITWFASSLNSPSLVESLLFRYEDSHSSPVLVSNNVVFGDSVRMNKAYFWKRGGGIEVTSHWSAAANPKKAKMLAVHVVDQSGTILAVADHELYRGAHDWVDRFFLEKRLLVNGTALGLAVYDDPRNVLPIEGGHCDWQNRRLILPLPTK